MTAEQARCYMTATREDTMKQVTDTLDAAGITWAGDTNGWWAVHEVLGCDVLVDPAGIVEVWEVAEQAEPDRVAAVLAGIGGTQ